MAFRLGTVWAYYGYWLNRHIEAVGERVRQAGMKRLYYYILSAIGLVVAFIGVATLFSFLIDMLTNYGIVLTDSLRDRLASSLSSLIVGLPLWLMTWRFMQNEAMAIGEMGDHARRSVIRRFYLYLALFGSVIGGMATAVGLVYQLIHIVLTGDAGSDFLNNVLNFLQLFFLFGIVLIYHLNVLRRDSASTASALIERQSGYSVLIVDSGNGFGASVKNALLKLGSSVQIIITKPDAKPQGNFKALLLSGDLAVDAPEWIRSFSGSRIIVKNEAEDIIWAEDAGQAAQSVQMLAEGQKLRTQNMGRSAWMIVIYVFAALFGLMLLSALLILGMALIGN